MVVYVFNPSTQEGEAGVQGQPSLQSEFQDCQGYKRETLSQETKTTTTWTQKVKQHRAWQKWKRGLVKG